MYQCRSQRFNISELTTLRWRELLILMLYGSAVVYLTVRKAVIGSAALSCLSCLFLSHIQLQGISIELAIRGNATMYCEY